MKRRVTSRLISLYAEELEQRSLQERTESVRFAAREVEGQRPKDDEDPYVHRSCQYGHV